MSDKSTNAPADRHWQWVFPQQNRWRIPKTGEQGPPHVHETILQQGAKAAVRTASVTKHVGCHTLRHCLATTLLESAYDIRTIQELLDHKHVSTSMRYTHGLSKGGHQVKSPIDGP